MRALWKGSISFGLVNIPIGLYPATRSDDLKFRLLRSSDLSPVNYKRVAAADGKEVPWDQIVKGYEYEKDKFVVLKDEDFKRVDVEATQTVDIMSFVELDEINPMYFHKPFYMEPTKAGGKAYALLRDALRDAGKVGIAKVVIRTRQYLAAVKPNGPGLILELMHFADEMVDAEELRWPEGNKASKGEMEMARTLIDRMTTPWKPEDYKDEYRTALLASIEKKIEAGGEEPAPATRRAKPATKVVDLMEVLRRSLGEAQKPAPRATTPGRSRAHVPSTRRRRTAARR